MSVLFANSDAGRIRTVEEKHFERIDGEGEEVGG
jgi:hypothetical protein